MTVDELAQEIRRVEGAHDLGAGALAEALMPYLRARTSEPEAGAVVNDNPLTFGMGALVVNTGRFGGDNAVFIANAKEPGEVGAYTGKSAFDRRTLQPGELVMIFPTAEQVQAVADALVGAHPSPATADKLRVAVERFRDALANLPEVEDRQRRGEQFNAYDLAQDDGFKALCIGPITARPLSLFEAPGDVADLVEAAFRVALATLSPKEEGGE